MITRRQYTKEFKLAAISLVLNQGRTTTEVSRSQEINANTLRRWVREYRKLLEIQGFVSSMSRTGDCFDNAVAESFFGSFKQERIHWRNYQTRHAAQQDMLQYISMFYNSHRLHSYLGYKSPNQYEVETEMLKKVA